MLTAAYARGSRKPYIAPFQLFLIANIAFFAVQSVSHDKIFSTPLASHLNNQDWSVLAQKLVASRLAARHTTFEAYAPMFDQAVAVNAKSLVVVMVLPFIMLLVPLFARSGRTFATHAVFALHFYAFQLLLLCVFLITLIAQSWFWGSDGRAPAMDVAMFGLQLTISAVYLYIATGRTYDVAGTARILKVAALIFAVAAVVLGYRFFLLLATLYTT